MTDFYPALQREAKDLCQTGPDTPERLLALAHEGYRAWAKVGNLHFPPEKRYALLQEILRYCASRCLLACCFTQDYRLREIADMLDASHPRYACTRARVSARRNRYGRPQF
ncbi:hypothetical protein [Cupriavidus sp. BIC8F]|uniref:hypothetical protein n=1 Tax=Cupriavidus sp. BIC8F TaxID=3079014 RepID=UPI0029167A2E|nr:hypothetical protein [Cupriavidus sp. BIC8F]